MNCAMKLSTLLLMAQPMPMCVFALTGLFEIPVCRKSGNPHRNHSIALCIDDSLFLGSGERHRPEPFGAPFSLSYLVDQQHGLLVLGLLPSEFLDLPVGHAFLPRPAHSGHHFELTSSHLGNPGKAALQPAHVFAWFTHQRNRRAH